MAQETGTGLEFDLYWEVLPFNPKAGMFWLVCLQSKKTL